MTGEQSTDDAVELLYRHLGALPSAELGPVNLMPFAQENDQTNMLKREVSKAIVQLFRDSGYPMAKDAPTPAVVSRDIVLKCRSCSSPLLHTRVDSKGVANIPAATVIAGMGSLNHDCPHDPLTPEDQRRKIEEAVLAAQADGSV
jgi:hypothetical protein